MICYAISLFRKANSHQSYRYQNMPYLLRHPTSSLLQLSFIFLNHLAATCRIPCCPHRTGYPAPSRTARLDHCLAAAVLEALPKRKASQRSEWVYARARYSSVFFFGGGNSQLSVTNESHTLLFSIATTSWAKKRVGLPAVASTITLEEGADPYMDHLKVLLKQVGRGCSHAR